MSRISLKQLISDLVTPESLAAHQYTWNEIVGMPQSGLLKVYNLRFKSEDGSSFECGEVEQ